MLAQGYCSALLVGLFSSSGRGGGSSGCSPTVRHGPAAGHHSSSALARDCQSFRGHNPSGDPNRQDHSVSFLRCHAAPFQHQQQPLWVKVVALPLRTVLPPTTCLEPFPLTTGQVAISLHPDSSDGGYMVKELGEMCHQLQPLLALDMVASSTSASFIKSGKAGNLCPFLQHAGARRD